MTFNEVPLDSKIEEKIVWAEACHRNNGKRIIKEEGIADLLSQLEESIAMACMEMDNIGLIKECRRCEDEEGGACCGRGLENKYSGILLLINLLLGRKLPRRRYERNSCYFLGEKGCSLLARHVICVNYICRKVADRIPPDKINRLREVEGIELNTLFLLNEKIRAILNRG